MRCQLLCLNGELNALALLIALAHIIIACNSNIAFMSAIPLRAISGIGRTLSSKLAPLDVSTCADVLRFSLPELAQHLGEEEAQFVRQLALGIDERPIVSGEVKPISISCNF